LKRMSVSPLLVVSRGAPVRVHPKVLRTGPEVIRDLHSLAKDVGVDLVLADDFRMLTEWSAVLREAQVGIKAPAQEVRLVRIDALGGVASYDEVRRGAPPGLWLPTSLDRMDALASSIIDLFEPKLRAAA